MCIRDRNNYEASLGASRVYYKMGQFDKAKEMAEKAMNIKMSGEASWAYAQACIALNKPAEAKTALEKVVESDPTNVVAQKALGNVYYKEKNCAKAIQYLKKSYSSQPDGEIALMIANCFKSLGNLDSAEIFYKEASRDRKSPQVEASLELARIYYKKEKYDDAVEEYGKTDRNLFTGQDFYNYGISIDKINGNREKMIEAFEAAAKKFGNAATPEMLIAKEKSGRYFLETKRYREALEALEFIRKSIGDAKINPEILFLIADAHQGLNQRQNAISILESVIAKDPKNVEAYARLADLYTKENQQDKAKGIYEKLLSLQPNNPDVFLALGQYNLKSQKYEEALKNFQKAFTLGQKAEAAVGMMKAAWELKKYDIARDAAESALNKDEKLREPQLILAKIFFMDKDYASAASKVEDLLKGDQKNLELLQLLADCYEKLNKKDKLADIDEKILELDKKNMKSGLRLANYLREEGNNKAAAEILRELLAFQPKNADIIKSLYEVSIKNGDKKAAVEYLSDYLKIKPNDANLQKEYGDMLYEQKDKEGALQAYRAAIKADPSIKGLYKRYAELIMTRKGATKEEEKEMIDVLTAAVKAGEADAEIYSTLGSIYKKQGAFPMAIDMYQKALQKDPKDVESMAGLAYCQERAGKLSDAIISYEQVTAMNPQSVKEYKSLGELYLKTGRREQGISAFKKYLEKTVDQEIALQVGDFEYEKGKFADAANYYAMVKEPKSSDTVFLQKYSDAVYKAGDMKKAEELLIKLSAINPKAPEPLLKLYEITLKSDKKIVAAQHLQKYTELRPTDATSLQKLGDLYYELKNDSAAIAAYKNLLKVNPKAKGFYNKYIELIDKRGTQEEKLSVYTNAVAAGEADATVYLFLGRASMKGGNYPKALQHFEKATQLDPNNIAAMKSLAECQKYTGNISGAILSYEQVVALDPKAEEEYKELGELYTKQNKNDNAISAYKKYLEKRSDDSISILVGDAALKKGNYNEAISYYEKVKGKDAQTEGFLLKYGDACLQAKKDDKAIDIYRKLSIINPQNPKIFKTLFDLLYKNDKKDDAIVYLKKYTELNPKDAEALKDLGDMLQARGDKSGAINAYQMAVKANPSIKGFYKKYAELVIEKGNEEEIANVLAGAVAANEADVEIYKRLGSIYLKRKLYDKAIPLFEKASQLEPQNVQILRNLADAQANV
ncbi:MAG: tetratricopeptide repeat protein, partial [Chitinispirillaceae bacterium]|nr:tetratricopeptide repeat protein [Chitinispirillaceae bacterium]